MNITDNIIPPASIMANLHIIKEVIESCDALADNAEVLIFQDSLVALQALATETQASAKFWLLEAMDKELDRQAAALKGDKIPPSIAKARADAKCREWHYIYELATRYSTNITHSLDAVRTKISFIKVGMTTINQ